MTGLVLLLIYAALFLGSYFAVHFIRSLGGKAPRPAGGKTIAFGDESAVRPDRAASVLSVLVIFLIWGAFTGSKWVPFHVPAPFVGETAFSYSARDSAGRSGTARVAIRVHEVGADIDPPGVSGGGAFVQDDAAVVGAWRSVLIRVADNDPGAASPGFRIVTVDDKFIEPGETVRVTDGRVTLTLRGSLSFAPAKGLQMEPVWMPSPEAVAQRFVEIVSGGYQNATLWQHIGWSLLRVFAGFLLGSLIGIPLGYAMGLSGWVRGWFDPIVEFMRPVPPLALIPLVIIWFGIWETGKIVLLFLAALWIMTIAARAGVSGVNISKVHAAYSLGASRRQVLAHVIVPNSLPEIFTGARVAMGVCWSTVVAAELVAAQKGVGMMIIAASKFQLTDIVIMGIILIGIVGYGIDMAMRMAERLTVPWKGRA
ncbi:ABC transporter permease [Tropicimonas sp.]|uniref:ABC transporter permease n=1 Tax=Tropicimonas sp. TaxID=2067044 RepID=UPI003A842B1A